jgi:hypothetical protein
MFQHDGEGEWRKVFWAYQDGKEPSAMQLQQTAANLEVE